MKKFDILIEKEFDSILKPLLEADNNIPTKTDAWKEPESLGRKVSNVAQDAIRGILGSNGSIGSRVGNKLRDYSRGQFVGPRNDKPKKGKTLNIWPNGEPKKGQLISLEIGIGNPNPQNEQIPTKNIPNVNPKSKMPQVNPIQPYKVKSEDDEQPVPVNQSVTGKIGKRFNYGTDVYYIIDGISDKFPDVSKVIFHFDPNSTNTNLIFYSKDGKYINYDETNKYNNKRLIYTSQKGWQIISKQEFDKNQSIGQSLGIDVFRQEIQEHILQQKAVHVRIRSNKRQLIFSLDNNKWFNTFLENTTTSISDTNINKNNIKIYFTSLFFWPSLPKKRNVATFVVQIPNKPNYYRGDYHQKSVNPDDLIPIKVLF